MYKLSEIISKKVVSLFEAKIVGEICGVFFDERMQKIKFFEICGGENDVNKFVQPKCVSFPIMDAMCVKNLSVLTPPEVKFCFTPVGLPCYDTVGKLLGIITDVCFDGAKVCSILAGNETISPDSVIKLNADILLVQAEGKKYKPLPPVVRVEDEPRLTLPPLESQSVSVSIPKRLGTATVSAINGYGFLVGKRLSRTVDAGGILREGTVITDEHVAKAEKCGKIVALALNAE